MNDFGDSELEALKKPYKSGNNSAAAPSERAFKLWSEINQVQAPDKLVRRLLGESSLACIYGESGCGKSFLALDLALHIALGWPWFGRDVQKGPTLYIAAEGQIGVSNRVAAFRKRYKQDLKATIPFAILPQPVDLFERGNGAPWLIEQMRLAVAEMKQEVGPKLLVVDTLNRCFGAGDESKTPDMSAFIANIDSVRTATGAAIVIVHHTGKDTARGERGSYALRASVDTSLEIASLTGTRTASIRKQKDGASDDAFTFDLEVETVGIDEGVPITSCVILPVLETAPTPATAGKKRRPISPETLRALDFLRDTIAAHGRPVDKADLPSLTATKVDLWRDHLKQRGLYDSDATGRQRFARAKERLIAEQLITIDGDLVWIVPAR